MRPPFMVIIVPRSLRVGGDAEDVAPAPESDESRDDFLAQLVDAIESAYRDGGDR